MKNKKVLEIHRDRLLNFTDEPVSTYEYNTGLIIRFNPLTKKKIRRLVHSPAHPKVFFIVSPEKVTKLPNDQQANALIVVRKEIGRNGAIISKMALYTNPECKVVLYSHANGAITNY